MFKENIISVRKVGMSSLEKEEMLKNLSVYTSAHPVIEVEKVYKIVFRHVVKFLRGGFIRS